MKIYAESLVKLNKIKEALTIFEKALQIEPNHVSILRNYGSALFQVGNYDKALNILDQAVQIEPNNVKVLSTYSKVLLKIKSYEKACDICERSLKINPDDIIALNSYGKALAESGNYEKACDIFERFLQIKSNNYISFIYARCLEHLGKYTDAISQLQAIDFDSLPQYHINVIHISLGRLYYCIRLYEQGDKYFNLALANSDDKEKSILSSARSILAHNPYNETAMKMLQQIAEESPRYSQALEMLSLNLSEEEYFKMVKSDYQSGVNDTEILNRA
ncbi:MAG: tetratricopeptide repeat protein, partial [Sphaerospermopsis kisseleviana]